MDDAAIIKDFKLLNASDSVACDHFFEKWGAGQTLDTINAPYERLESYRHVLQIIQKADPEKYNLVHKGTPFFFIGILMFDCKNFETAIFYITAALSEDRRRSADTSLGNYITTPAGQILSLDRNTKWQRITSILVIAVEEVIDDFNTENSTSITAKEFVQKFIHPMLQQEHYAIVTSLYSYVLDYEEKSKNLHLAGGSVDSMEPILVNLFKGALIFETLLKYYYSHNDRGYRIMTLGGFSRNSSFTSNFPSVNLSIPTTTLQDILDDATGNGYKTTMENTARIRNTTGHKLTWDNIFTEPDNYRKLFKQEIFAILNVVTKQW